MLPVPYKELFLFHAEVPRDEKIEIYTDGSAFHHWYGWAYVVFWQGHIIFDASGGGYSSDKKHASILSEMEAVKNAVIWAEMNCFRAAVIISDAQVIVAALNSTHQQKGDSFLTKFINWMNSRPLKNVHHYQFIKGHTGHLGNVMADYFAEIARIKLQQQGNVTPDVARTMYSNHLLSCNEEELKTYIRSLLELYLADTGL